MADLQWGPECDWCQISASVDRPTYKATENVLATVILKNISAKSVAYQAYPFAPGNDYEVTRDGQAVPLTAYGQGMRDSADDFVEGSMPLEPGENVVYEIFLNRDFDLTLAGQYQLRATRAVNGANHKGLKAASNVVEFEIVDR